MAQRSGVLFDLDGTLIDSNYLHTLAWSRALVDCGEWAPSNAIHRLVGMGGDQLVPELVGHAVDGADDRRAARYGELIAEVRPLPGATGTVAKVRALGICAVLATSAPKAELSQLIGTIGGEDAFDAITGADDAGGSKPAPDIFLVAASSAGCSPERCIAVGDSIWDIRGARAAGMACVGLETGGFSRHELSEAGAIAVYRDIEELGRQLLTSPLAALGRA